jgi:hypothetical protein
MPTPRTVLLTALLAAATFATAQTHPDPTPAPLTVFVNPRAASTDPRIGLKPGMFDAGEAASGLQHLTLVKKPAAFIPAAAGPDAHVNPGAALAYANSDLAFQGHYAFMGNFYGITIYDIADPAKARLVTTIVCPGGQGDVSVYKNLMFMSVEGGGRLDCGTQGIAPPAGYVAPKPPTPGEMASLRAEAAAATAAGKPMPARIQQLMAGPPPSKERIRGIRIFDIADITNPKQVAVVQNCRGSHTHTLLVDPNDKENVYIYIAGTANSRSSEELAGCTSGGPTDATTANFTIVVVKVPVAHPELARVVSSPRIFADPASGKMDSLMSAQVHGEGTARPTTGCHDITVFSALGLAAGACAGNGILLDIKDPVHPTRVAAVNDPNFSFWHSANFSNDGSKLIFTDEWGGGTAPRCRATDPMQWGADTIFDLSKDHKLTLDSYYKMPAAQTELENCVAHNGSILPVPGRDILVQAWYQGGISVMDFTDAKHPMEIAYFDRGPINPARMDIAGEWSAYWYNGFIYGSEIGRGLDVLKLVPSKYLTQNEIDAANQVHFDELNVQNQPQVSWPSSMTVASAYVDQLARNPNFPADKIASLRKVLAGNRPEANKVAAERLTTAAATMDPADAKRMLALAAILKK